MSIDVHGIPVGSLALVACVALAVTRGSSAEADRPNPTVPVDLGQYRLIVDRNIFDPERRKPSERETRPVERDRPPREEVLGLTGTMRYAGKAFAFFDGSDSAFRGVFSLGDDVAGFRIVEIDVQGVTLDRGGEESVLAVGKQLQRRGDGPWTASDTVLPLRQNPSAAGAGPETATAAAPEAAPAAADGGMSDTLKRMLERRRQELGR